MSDIFTVLVSPLLWDLPGGECVNPSETAAKVIYLDFAGKDKAFSNEQQTAGDKQTARTRQWISVLEVLSGIDSQLREIQVNFREFLGNSVDLPSWNESVAAECASLTSGVRASAISALVERTEKAIQGINEEISEMLHENSTAREFVLHNGAESRRSSSSEGVGVQRPYVNPRSHWA